MEKKKLRIEEVALVVGVSIQTINNWYRWKKLHEDDELATLLPNYEQVGERQIRYWDQNDVWSIMEFKKRLPHGRNGILGEITQKHTKYRKGDK